jgi:hypothetical protein
MMWKRFRLSPQPAATQVQQLLKLDKKYQPETLGKPVMARTRTFFSRYCNSWAPVAPSYSRGRDHEDRGSKPAWANSSRDPILKKPFTKKGLVE